MGRAKAGRRARSGRINASTSIPPAVCVQATQAPAMTNFQYNPQVPSSLNSGIDPAQGIPLRFHPGLPLQNPNSVWTFNGTIPPKLVMGRYGEPLLFRHTNGLPVDVRQNGGFGRHTISTHEHNGHHGAENDGFTGAFFFPNQFYDYHWPIVLAGRFSMNTGATDPMASTPDDNGAPVNIPGDWHETMSTHWFHDHMFSFTAQNVYKGNAAMFNIYSGLDRGNEAIIDEGVNVNLRLPSGTAKPWGNLDYDVNLMLADKAMDDDGQLTFDIFNFDGFLGDVMTTNLVYNPFFDVERRKYRFRILNGAVARFFKIALANASGVAQPIVQIGNDGNLLPNPVTLMELDEQGIAERYDIVIDFSQFQIGDKLHLVNLAEHYDPDKGALNGRKPVRNLSMAEALSGTSLDPCVGRFLEFRVRRNPDNPDLSQIPAVMIPNPDLSLIPITRIRNFTFDRDAEQTTFDPRYVLRRRMGHHHRRRASPVGRLWAGVGGAEIRHARSLESDQQRRRVGPPDSHPLRRGADSGAQRQLQQRAPAGARPEGRVSTHQERHGDDHDAVPRLGRDVHGALPQHDPRGQRDAAPVGDQRRTANRS